ncbi:hypothetical protein BDY21DRAFT_356724 [Lineolata rhizophorae]|uniref:Uncharacterized protein n=1 Tax=Lineolata rhizophorae TaxID=578093 RepID=A0A6A6NN46_9PEZI|nr:hypothetical protein BDY21DRAFT_356724 [Lineolata rhizophorae]
MVAFDASTGTPSDRSSNSHASASAASSSRPISSDNPTPHSFRTTTVHTATATAADIHHFIICLAANTIENHSSELRIINQAVSSLRHPFPPTASFAFLSLHKEQRAAADRLKAYGAVASMVKTWSSEAESNVGVVMVGVGGLPRQRGRERQLTKGMIAIAAGTAKVAGRLRRDFCPQQHDGQKLDHLLEAATRFRYAWENGRTVIVPRYEGWRYEFR